MAYFARQKRQTRFYWAELGFMALGLLGLQPSLFTNLIKGSQSKSIALTDDSYPKQQGQSLRGYAYLPTHQQFESILPAYAEFPANQVNGWQQPAVASYPYASQQLYNLPQPYPTTQPYAVTQPYSTTQHYAATQPYTATLPYTATQPYPTTQPNSTALQPYSALQQPYTGAQSLFPQPDYSQPLRNLTNTAANSYSQQYGTAPSKYHQNGFQPAQPSHANGSQNATSYLAQANAGYSPAGYGASGVSSNNWSASQPVLYGGGQNSGSNPYNAFAPRLTQNQMFENGSNSNYYGSTSAQSFPNQSGSSSSFQRYRAPSPLYR
jgi:hypothetical protein